MDRTLARRILKEVHPKASAIEKRIFKLHKDPTEYNQCLRTTIEWLRVYKPKVSPAVFVSWDEQEWRRHHRPIAKQHTEWQLEIMPKTLKPMKETLIRCVACGEHSVTFFLIQTRSADEPMCRVNTCTACGKEWRSHDG